MHSFLNFLTNVSQSIVYVHSFTYVMQVKESADIIIIRPISMYHMAENICRVKHWRIWQVVGK